MALVLVFSAIVNLRVVVSHRLDILSVRQIPSLREEKVWKRNTENSYIKVSDGSMKHQI